MEFQGQSISATVSSRTGIGELCFDRRDGSVNKLDDRTIGELREATRWLLAQGNLRGVLVTSRKDAFIVGADIGEFANKFDKTAVEVSAGLAANSAVFTEFEDLPVPSAAAISGFALGGGLEMALAANARFVTNSAIIGFPEIKLGIFPGYGGTVRLMRLAGPAEAAEWITSGTQINSARAVATGVVDAVVETSNLRGAALDWLDRAIGGEVDWRLRRRQKLMPVARTGDEITAIFDAVRSGLPDSRHQPAARMALAMMEQGAALDRDDALALEAEVFGHVARTQAARSMIQIFVDDQLVKKMARGHEEIAQHVRQAALLGFGAIGQEIAYLSAAAGVPVSVSEISSRALRRGLKHIRGRTALQVDTGHISQSRADAIFNAIRPATDEGVLAPADLIVETINENLAAKQMALANEEAKLRGDAILATTTSYLSVADIGRRLARPANLVGMHFLNPVLGARLVEVVRGRRTSTMAVATATAYVLRLGKTPIVVKDGPGYLINRLLTSYIGGFLRLIADGADFRHIDRVMESFGWAMGPACFEDFIGIDTGSSIFDVISTQFPMRMPRPTVNALQLLTTVGRLGRKVERGFYRYKFDGRGRLQRSIDPDMPDLLSDLQRGCHQSFDDAGIIDRMMLPMVIEASVALEEGVVGTAAELDAASRVGLGFPLHAGGPLMYADWLGLPEVMNRCKRLQHLGPAYEPSETMVSMAKNGARYRTR